MSNERVNRPWGYYESLMLADNFQVKNIMVKPGAKLSLQSHQHRAEHWVVVQGVATVVCGDKTLKLERNQSIYIPQQAKHRLSNESDDILHVIEVQCGDYLGEDDITRYEDDYGRS
ncbi:MAG: cupin domain-containing protein [Pseudomonadota bacterium]